MLGELTDVDAKAHHVAAGNFQVARNGKMSSCAATRISGVVLLFFVDYVSLKMKESWVGAVVLHFYQPETKTNDQKPLRDDGSSITAARERTHADMSPSLEEEEW